MDQDNTVSSSTGEVGENNRPAGELPLQSSEVGSSGQPADKTDWFEWLRYEKKETDIGWCWRWNPQPDQSGDDEESDDEESAAEEEQH